MFTFFHRRSATARNQPGVEQSVASTSPEDLARLKRFARDFAVSGRFVEPGNDEHDLWHAGKLVPWYITHLLDNGQHTGPAVDLACHAKEPAVDLWEAGKLYPDWDQTVALARLLDVPVRDLTHPDARPHHHPNRPQRRPRGMAILSFEPSAVHAATTSTAASSPGPQNQ